MMRINPGGLRLYHGTTKDFSKPKLNGLGILWLTENPRVAAQYGHKHYVRTPIAYVWEIDLKPTAKIVNLRDLSNRAIYAAFQAQNEANRSGMGDWSESDWKQRADFGVLERWGWMVGLLKKKGLDGVYVQDTLGTVDIPHSSVALFKLSAIERIERLEIQRSTLPSTIGDIHRDIHNWRQGERLATNGRRLQSQLRRLAPELAESAQRVYDTWEQDENGEDQDLGAGGICDLVAQEMASVLERAGIDFMEGGHDGDDHAFLIAYDADEAFTVDIPPGVYETGSGYSWRKRPGVTIDASDVMIDAINRGDIEPEGDW